MQGSTARVWPDPECFQALGSPPGLPQNPMMCKGGLQKPQGESRVSLWFPRVRAGTSKEQRSHACPPLGQPQLDVPREKSRPRGLKPLQPIFPKYPHRRKAADHYAATKPQSSSVRHGTIQGGGLRSSRHSASPLAVSARSPWQLHLSI